MSELRAHYTILLYFRDLKVPTCMYDNLKYVREARGGGGGKALMAGHQGKKNFFAASHNLFNFRYNSYTGIIHN